MNIDNDFPMEGGCTCRAVRYRMTTKPLFVHCCHCRWCQPGGALSNDDQTVVRALLSLPLVST